MAAWHKAALGIRAVLEHRAAPLRRGAHGVVAYHAREQDHRYATEDGSPAADPLHRDLLTTLAAANRELVSILTTMYRKPFTVDGFSQWMRDAIAAAGLPLMVEQDVFTAFELARHGFVIELGRVTMSGKTRVLA
jgi:succinylglutamate desuccinylase